MLFFPAFSLAFYALYITAGVSDMVDGWVARRTHTASELGAKLDTIADIVFVVVCLVKLLPVVDITTWLYVWIGIIALIKIINHFQIYRSKAIRFSSQHDEQSYRTAAVCFPADHILHRFEIQRSSTLLFCHLRRHSGRTFY